MITTILVIITLLLPRSISAAVKSTATPTLNPEQVEGPTPTSSTSQEILKLVQQKIQALNNPDSVTTKKAIIGTIVDIKDKSLTLENQNDFRNVTLDPDTVYIDAKKNKSSLSQLKTNQDLLCLGYLHPDNTFEARRIVVIDLKTIVLANQLVSGKIVQFSKTSSVLALISPKNKDLQYQIKFNTKTVILDRQGNKVDPKSLTNGQNLAALVYPDPKSPKSYLATKLILNTVK